jgi:CxxC motif-containing protein
MNEVKPTRFTCVICPTGCSITVSAPASGPLQITGATCKRGKEYAEQEYREPKRMLITTMRIDGGVLPVLPVRSDKALPKQRIFEAVQFVSTIALRAPIKMGTVVVPNLLNLGVDVIASRDMRERQPSRG